MNNSHAAYLALLECTWQQWPDMRRYEATARLEMMLLMHSETGQWMRGQCMTVTIFDKRNERQGEHDERVG